jgi:hypothetical protein
MKRVEDIQKIKTFTAIRSSYFPNDVSGFDIIIIVGGAQQGFTAINMWRKIQN